MDAPRPRAYVEAMFVIAGEFGIDIHLDGDGHTRFQQTIDTPVILDRRDDDLDLTVRGDTLDRRWSLVARPP